MHAASRHGIPTLTSLPKDGGVSCLGGSSGGRSFGFYTEVLYTELFNNLLVEFNPI